MSLKIATLPLVINVTNIGDNFLDNALKVVNEKFEYYDDFIFGIILASSLVLIYHRFVGFYFVKKSYETRLQGKDETIKALQLLVYERLDKIEVEEMNSGIWAKIKRSFKVK